MGVFYREDKNRMKQYGKSIINEVKSMKEISKTRREIAMYFNLRNKKSVRVLLKRNRPNQKNWEFRILPHRRGRPPKEHIPKVQEKKNEIKRLKIENELLHSFLLSRYIKINGIISSEILWCPLLLKTSCRGNIRLLPYDRIVQC